MASARGQLELMCPECLGHGVLETRTYSSRAEHPDAYRTKRVTECRRCDGTGFEGEDADMGNTGIAYEHMLRFADAVQDYRRMRHWSTGQAATAPALVKAFETVSPVVLECVAQALIGELNRTIGVRSGAIVASVQRDLDAVIASLYIDIADKLVDALTPPKSETEAPPTHESHATNA